MPPGPYVCISDLLGTRYAADSNVLRHRPLVPEGSRMSVPATFRTRVDVRCEVDVVTSGATARCQLMVGHEGIHAALSVADGAQLIWLWTGDQVHREPYRSELAAGRPWAPGLPAPEFRSSLKTTKP
jgi:hypothetical protein